MKRILLVTSEFPPGPGGIGTHAFQLASYLASQAVGVCVLTPQDYASEDEIKQFNQAQSFEIKRLHSTGTKFSKFINRFTKLHQVIQKDKPDLVLASGARAVWLTFLVTRLRRQKFIVIGHGTEFGAKGTLQVWFTKLACNQADLIICVSRYTQKAMQHLGITKPESIVIHNGADEKQFYKLTQNEVQSFRKQVSVGDKFVLLTVGQVSERKGQEVVIRALPSILKVHPQTSYWMAGLPTQEDHLRNLANELGVLEHIYFWGKVDNDHLRLLYNSADLFVMTSRKLSDGDFEGFGIAVIEAALCGKAAVVTSESGLAEAVHADETGLLVPQDDPIATAEAISRLITDDQLLQSLSNNAFQFASYHLTWSVVGQQYHQVLQQEFEKKNQR